MRSGDARWRRDAPALTRRPQPFVLRLAAFGAARRQTPGQMLRRWIRSLGRSLAADLGSVAIDWKGEIPIRTPGKRDKPLR